MAKRTIVWTSTAAKQRREVLRYWTEKNGSSTYVKKLIQLTRKHIKIIETQPKAFKKADFPNTRVSAMGHFSLFYKITPKQIIVTAFWDNRQDPKVLLKLLSKE